MRWSIRDIHEFSVMLLDPPPLEIDKHIKNLKKVELRIPVFAGNNRNTIHIKVQLTGNK